MKARLILRMSDDEWQSLKDVARQNNLNPEEMMTKALKSGLDYYRRQPHQADSTISINQATINQ